MQRQPQAPSKIAPRPARTPWASEMRPAAIGRSGSALHARVDLALQGFVERARAGRDQANAQQCIQQTALHTGDARKQRAKIKAAPAGDQHQRHDLDFEEFAQVVDQRGRGPGFERVAVRTALFSGCGKLGLGDGVQCEKSSAEEFRAGTQGALVDDTKRNLTAPAPTAAPRRPP